VLPPLVRRTSRPLTSNQTSGSTLAVGLLSLAVVLGLRRWLPLIPGALAAVLLGIAAVAAFGLDQHGVAIVGPIQSGLPSFGLPTGLVWHDYLALVGPAAGVLLVGFAEGLAAAKTYAARAGYDIDANRELTGLGVANLGAGLTSGMVVNGSLSKTAVNGGAGARSQISGLTVAALTVVTLLFLTGLFEQLPEATLAAIVIAAVIELVDIPALRRLYRVWTERLGGIYGPAARADFLAAIAAMLGVLVFDTLPGLVIGIAVSMTLLLYRASRPHVTRLARTSEAEPAGLWVDADRHPDLPTEDAILVIRVESGLFFANADHTCDRIRALATPGLDAIVLDGEATPFIDVTAAATLDQLTRELAARGVRLYFAREIGQVRDVLHHTDNGSVLVIYPDVDAAVTAARTQSLSPDK
jgi:SulP family sulfate permease